MPSATRQATPGPGPSTTARSATKPLKRSHTAASSTAQGQAQGTDSSKENASDGREPKKMRMDPNATLNSTAVTSATTNGRRNARSASVVSSAAENTQQNGERIGRAKNKRRRKKKRTPVVVQPSTASIVEVVVAPTTHQQLANQSQSQPSQNQSLPTAGTGEAQSRGKGRDKKRNKAKEEEIADAGEDAANGLSVGYKENCNGGEGDNSDAGSDEPLPPLDENKEDEDEDNDEPRISSSEKGKGKARMDTPVEEGSRQTAPTSATDDLDTASELERLREELSKQTSLVNRHQTHLNQSQQSLTCQICLDLLHRPYALSPCGHVTCYPCLVRWFTAPRNPNPNEAGPSNEAENEHSVDHLLDAPSARRGAYVRRSKTCPLCRTVVSERPVEMWTIKAMVASLVRSNLSDLPVPPPTQSEPGPSTETAGPGERARDTDPWRNIFRRARAGPAGGASAANFLEFLNGLQHVQPDGGPGIRLHQIFGQNAAAAVNANANANGGANANAAANAENNDNDPAQVGMFDQEDGIYRCIQCMHEIWNGICTACHRRYPAHRALMENQMQGGRRPRYRLATAAATRGPMMRNMGIPIMDSDSDSGSSEGVPNDFVMDDIDDMASEDGDLRQRDIEDHNHLVMRALMGDDIEDEADDLDHDGYGYDDLERALAAEDRPYDEDDGEDDEGAFADIPIWRDDWADDSDEDMDDFYVGSDEGEEDPDIYRQAYEHARAFGGRMRMGGPGYHVDFDHIGSDEEGNHSDEEDSQYGGSFIDDAGPSHDEASGSDTDLQMVAIQAQGPRNIRVDMPIHAQSNMRRPLARIQTVDSDSDRGRPVTRRRLAPSQVIDSDSDGEVQIIEPLNRRPSNRQRVLSDDDDEEEEVEVVSELRGTGNAVASGSGSHRESRTRTGTAGHQEGNSRPTPAAAAAAAAMRRAQRTVAVSEDEDEEPHQARRSSRTTRVSGSGNDAEAGPSGSTRTLRRR